ncbi:hypothetical protein PCI56_07625 [Plesiomonas shigelloides subsp. oncorhynchi]|nr:hypothetical protein [Plesiomonas shigelloides]
MLLLGQMTSSGTASPLQVVEVPVSESAIDSLFGVGSMMALASKRYRKANGYTRTFAIPIADLTEGAAAEGAFTFAGPAVQAGTLYLLVAGQSVQVGVAANATDETIATSVAAAINAKTNLPVTAVVDSATPKK